MCNDSQLVMDNERLIVRGDPTEGALITSAKKAGLDQHEENLRLPNLDRIPFESEHQYMVTLHRSLDTHIHVIYIKGAVEKILERCTHELMSNNELISCNKEKILKTTEEMASNGLRVLAFAKRILTNNQDKISHEDANGGFIF